MRVNYVRVKILRCIGSFDRDGEGDGGEAEAVGVKHKLASPGAGLPGLEGLLRAVAEVILRGLEGVAEPQGPAVDAAVGERHPSPHMTRHSQGLHSVAVVGDAVVDTGIRAPRSTLYFTTSAFTNDARPEGTVPLNVGT